MTDAPVSVPVFDRAVRSPDDWAIMGDAGPVTWSEASDVIARIAEAIRTSDLGIGRRVLVVGRNRPATLIAHAAASLGEASSVPVNFHLTGGEIAYILEQSGASLVFADSATARAVAEATSGTSARVVHLPDEGATGPELDAFIGSCAPLRPSADQRVIPSLLFTSGTTGTPKAVQLPPKTIGASPDLAGFIAHITSHRLAKLGPHYVAGPLYHNGPLTAARLLLAAVPIAVPDRFDAEATLQAINELRIESSIMVPTHFVRLLALPEEVRARYDLASLRSVAHTGGRCPIEVKRAMIEWWGPVLTESYGGTESGTVCSIGSEEWLEHPGSVGRSVPPFTALIVDGEGEPQPPGTEGRLYFADASGRGIVFEGDPDKTAAAHLSPGVFTLGEIGYIDDDGYVFITDRFSDMVVSGGVNIYPAEAEQRLMAHPAVADVACIGIPDAEMGESLIALVEPVVAEPDPDLGAELIEFCRGALAGYKCPRSIRFVGALPRNPMGKIDKRALRTDHRLQRDP